MKNCDNVFILNNILSERENDLKTILICAAIAITCFIQNARANTVYPKVLLETNQGEIVLELYPEKAPETVENFLKYVRDGFYNGTIFHRVIKGFMIQGGGMTEGMSKKTTLDPVKNEAYNGLKNLRGTVAMARTMDPHSATAQFFINTVDNGFLDFKGQTATGWGYCVFGKVIKGMEVVDAIEQMPTTKKEGHSDVPRSTVVLKKAIEIK